MRIFRVLALVALLAASGACATTSGLVEATYARDAAKARTLVDKGVDVNAVVDLERGTVTPLMAAIEVGDLALAEELLRRGAAPNVAIEKRKNPTALAIACAHVNVAAVELLLRHGARAQPGKDGHVRELESLSNNATDGNDADAARVVGSLVKAGLVLPTESGPNTFLFDAIYRGLPNLVKAYLEHGMPVNGRGLGYYPLLLALEAAHADVILLLLDAGADATVRTDSGNGALDMLEVGASKGALSADDRARVKARLIEAGAAPTK